MESPFASIHSQRNLNDLICVHFFTATFCFMIGVQGLNDDKCGATIDGIGTFRLSNNACDTIYITTKQINSNVPGIRSK